MRLLPQPDPQKDKNVTSWCDLFSLESLRLTLPLIIEDCQLKELVREQTHNSTWHQCSWNIKEISVNTCSVFTVGQILTMFYNDMHYEGYTDNNRDSF